jgi:hypothetical protein
MGKLFIKEPYAQVCLSRGSVKKTGAYGWFINSLLTFNAKRTVHIIFCQKKSNVSAIPSLLTLGALDVDG